MATIRNRDKRTGVTYVYESKNYWDKEAKKVKSHRKLIGKLDENGNVVPTSGRRGRTSKNPEKEKVNYASLSRSLQAKVDRLTERVNSLEAENEQLLGRLKIREDNWKRLKAFVESHDAVPAEDRNPEEAI